MFIDYTPEGQATQRLEFKPGRVKLSEQARIERLYAREAGQKASFLQFVLDVRGLHATALRVLLFSLLRRQHPQIRWEDVDPTGEEIEVLYHQAELRELRDRMQQFLPDGDDKTAALADLDAEIAAAPDADEEEPGKANGSTSSTSTGDSEPERSPKRGRSTTSRLN